MRISDYDKFDYDYKTYWEKRSYENEAEHKAINSLLRGRKGGFFLDIGGSYGRLLETYSERFENPVILDYSLKTLQRNSEILKSQFPHLHLVAANVYFMPFRENVFDGAMMIRVLHHIERPAEYLEEIRKVMRPGAVYLQEFANKIHLKARIRALLRLDFSFFSHTPYQQPTQQNFEGSNGQETVFLNYHPTHIKRLLRNTGFEVHGARGTSFFRLDTLKRLIPQHLLLGFEAVSQRLLSWLNISPSVILSAALPQRQTPINNYASLEDILVCPRCKSALSFESDSATCTKCKGSYRKVEGIWDFRVDEDES